MLLQKRRRCCVTLVAALTLAGAMARAQTLSLDDCLHLALQKNQRLAAAGFGVRSAEQRLKEAGALRKPNLNLDGGASFASGLDPALTEGGEYEGLLEIKQPLYDGAIKPLQQQAAVSLQQATSAKGRTAAEVRLDVRLAYINLLRAQKQLALTQTSLKDLQSYLETVRSLAHGGAVPKTDVMKVELQLQSETIALNDLRVAVAMAEKRLLEPLGLPLDTTIAIQDSVALPAAPERFVSNLDLKEFGFNIESAKLEVQLARAERAPVISAFGNAGGWTSRNQLIETGAPHVFGFHAGLSFELPLWNGGATSARVEQKLGAMNVLLAEVEVLRRSFETEFQINAQQHRSAIEKLNLLQASRQKALEQYDILQAQYAGGSASALEVLDAHRTYLEIVLEEEQTRAEMNMLHAQLQRLTGEQE